MGRFQRMTLHNLLRLLPVCFLVVVFCWPGLTPRGNTVNSSSWSSLHLAVASHLLIRSASQEESMLETIIEKWFYSIISNAIWLFRVIEFSFFDSEQDHLGEHSPPVLKAMPTSKGNQRHFRDAGMAELWISVLQSSQHLALSSSVESLTIASTNTLRTSFLFLFTTSLRSSKSSGPSEFLSSLQCLARVSVFGSSMLRLHARSIESSWCPPEVAFPSTSHW